MRNFARTENGKTQTERTIYLAVHEAMHPNQPAKEKTPDVYSRILNAFDRKWERSFLIGTTFVVGASELRDPSINRMVNQAISDIQAKAEAGNLEPVFVIVANMGYMNDTFRFSSISTIEARNLVNQYLNSVARPVVELA